MLHFDQSASRQITPAGMLQSIATMTGHRERELLAQALVNTLTELIPSKQIAMYRVWLTDKGEEAILLAETGPPSGDLSPSNETIIAISDHTVFNSVIHSGIEHTRSLDKETSLSVYPISSQHGVIGLIGITHETRHKLDNHLILAFLKVYNNYLAILDESETDTLTGLLNRRTFDNNIEKIIAEYSPPDDESTDENVQHPARRKEMRELPHWLAAIDIDHFKRINDKFGHLYGDEVLLLLSRIMQSTFRQRDKLFRFGGEEFIVVLDRTSEENAKAVLDRFRQTIEEYHFPQVGKVTVSIGFVRLEKVEVSSAIIGRADQALYYAKDHGRNQVCYYDNLVAEGKLAGEHYSGDMELF